MIITSIVFGEKSLKELKLQLFTMSQWHKNDLPTYYIFTDSATNSKILDNALEYKGVIKTKDVLNKYSGLTRQQMEKTPGDTFPTRWADLMAEKIRCIRWAFSDLGMNHKGVFFMDTDITLLAPMPQIPIGATVALSPHYIKKTDTDRYGYYNGGFGWLSDTSFCDIWEQKTHTSRFFEQAALEDVALAATGEGLYEFPIQYNYGWWRMFQSSEAPEAIARKMGIHRTSASAGITYDGSTLCSIHSHFTDKTDRINTAFNTFICDKLALLRSHPPALELSKYIQKNFS